MNEKIKPSRVKGVITAPSSKSYAQRAIAAGLLAKGTTTLRNMELCSDTRASMSTAEALGAVITQTNEDVYTVRGGLNPVAAKVNIGESGLATRLFTPIASLYHKPLTIEGRGSILKRPVDMMEVPLRNLGVKVKSKKGFLPITVCGPLKGGETDVDGAVSSQFITGLLMASPLALNDTVLRVSVLNSIPYISMTMDLAERFGVSIQHNDYKEFYIEGGQEYEPITYDIEGDWSAASCMLVAGAIAGEVAINNLNPVSLQADVAIINALSKAGAEIITTINSVTVKRQSLHAFEFDATHCPDLFPALVALAANCEGETVITGTKRLMHKESNRTTALKEEFEKMGIEVDIEEENTMRIRGGQVCSAIVSSHNDHRIAMATAVAGLNAPNGVVVKDSAAVDKSYPKFWDDLKKISTDI